MARKGNDNKQLHAAIKSKKDEFYTQLSDIEKEMRYYRKHFKGKVIFCNCDDPFESNFFKYFVLNFNRLELKKLIATCYTGSPIANQQLTIFDILGEGEENQNKPYKAVVTTVYDKTGDGGVDMLDVAELFKSGENELTELIGDGDFRSEECLELMDEADIVVTNPPFSLFREYVATLFEHKKDFIIIGNQNAITYKEIFPLFMENKMWYGASIHSHGRDFRVPDDYPLKAYEFRTDENGYKYINVKGVRWFTNLDLKQRHEEMILVKKYDPELYPKYDNYDAINVDKTADIPYDYVPCWFECPHAASCEWAENKGMKQDAQALCDNACAGNMGVPISFIDKYSPDQFDIIDANDIRTNETTPIKKHGLIKDADASITIKRNLTNAEKSEDALDRQTDRQTERRITYARIVIRRKKM